MYVYINIYRERESVAILAQGILAQVVRQALARALSQVSACCVPSFRLVATAIAAPVSVDDLRNIADVE